MFNYNVYLQMPSAPINHYHGDGSAPDIEWRIQLLRLKGNNKRPMVISADTDEEAFALACMRLPLHQSRLVVEREDRHEYPE